MSDIEAQKAEEVLKEIRNALQNDDIVIRLHAIAQLHSLNYSSEAIRNDLEKLALFDRNEDVRKNALIALDLPTQRNIRNRLNKIERGIRYLLLQEIGDWERLGLLRKENGDVIRRRYNFDTTPSSEQAEVSKPVINALKTQTAAPESASVPSSIKTEPRQSLLQSLLSEASIKIYLYLGAFFVIASASILGAAVPDLRLPILILGTFIFGGLSLATIGRLPQPSFAVFIVFSFLLLITANTIHATMQPRNDLSVTFNAKYWTFVFFMMALIWSGSTWLYTSRLFSITAFLSLTFALIGIGRFFDAEAEVYTTLASLAALLGLACTWFLKKWKDANFALPLFLTAQLLQVILLFSSISIYGIRHNSSLLHLAFLITWVFAFGFFILSDILFPFIFFPWLAAGALIPMPWFIATAFNIDSLASAILLLFWGIILSAVSEITHRFDADRKYSLPLLLASIPTFIIALVAGFTESNAIGMIAAISIALIYSSLHFFRHRWWLWTLALLVFSISYFAFFNLEVMQKMDVFIGYQILGISILFLLPDIFLTNNWKTNLSWLLPTRLYGALFTIVTSLTLPIQSEAGHIAVSYGVYTLFFAVYALAQSKANIGYLSGAYLSVSILFAFDYFNIDAWLPTLTAMALLYFVSGFAVRSKKSWSFMLRNSALILGAFISFTALFIFKESDSYGLYPIIIGILFAAEMYLREDGIFEIGMPVMFNISAFLILREFNLERVTHHVFAYSLVWILSDLMAHLTFTNPRPLKMVVRIIGGLFAIISYGFLFTESDAFFAATRFGIFTLLFLTVGLLYRQPNFFYAFTLTLPLFVIFLFRNFEITQWIHPVIFVAVAYYACGFFLRLTKRAPGWDTSLLNSCLGLGVIVSIASPILGGLDAAIPVAIAATLWAVEALAKENAWLAFPANGLYLLAYFIILGELNVDEPQFFSIGAALLGMIQHYLLVRAGSKSGAFAMGMISQFILLGTTYIEMLNKNDLSYFFVLFFQSLVVLVYGLIVRSRSLTFFPIGFVVLGVITIVNNALEGVGAIFVIGCAGIILLILGVFAVMMRERISKLSEKISDWKA